MSYVVPIADEVDLKAAAKAVGEKSVEMIHVKDITTDHGICPRRLQPARNEKSISYHCASVSGAV